LLLLLLLLLLLPVRLMLLLLVRLLLLLLVRLLLLLLIRLLHVLVLLPEIHLNSPHLHCPRTSCRTSSVRNLFGTLSEATSSDHACCDLMAMRIMAFKYASLTQLRVVGEVEVHFLLVKRLVELS
jgi:hypothetical protein